MCQSSIFKTIKPQRSKSQGFTFFFLTAAVEEIRQKMTSVKHKVLVLSGKGGVGKSTFSAHLSHALASDDSTEVSPKKCRTFIFTHKYMSVFVHKYLLRLLMQLPGY